MKTHKRPYSYLQQYSTCIKQRKTKIVKTEISVGKNICVAFYVSLTNTQPGDNLLHSKHVAIKTTHKVVLTDFNP